MSGSVAAAIEGQAKRVVGDVTRQYLNGVRFFVCEHATRNPVLPRIIDAVAQESAVRIVEKSLVRLSLVRPAGNAAVFGGGACAVGGIRREP